MTSGTSELSSDASELSYDASDLCSGASELSSEATELTFESPELEIVIPGMPGYLDVCMHGCMYVCIDAFCRPRTELCGLRTCMKCMIG